VPPDAFVLICRFSSFFRRGAASYGIFPACIGHLLSVVCIPFARALALTRILNQHTQAWYPLPRQPRHHHMLPPHAPRRPHRIRRALAPCATTAVPHLVFPLCADRALLLVPDQIRRPKETGREDRAQVKRQTHSRLSAAASPTRQSWCKHIAPATITLPAKVYPSAHSILLFLCLIHMLLTSHTHPSMPHSFYKVYTLYV